MSAPQCMIPAGPHHLGTWMLQENTCGSRKRQEGSSVKPGTPAGDTLLGTVALQGRVGGAERGPEDPPAMTEEQRA